MTVTDMLQTHIENKCITSFTNVNIAFRIYKAIFGSSYKVNVIFCVKKN